MSDEINKPSGPISDRALFACLYVGAAAAACFGFDLSFAIGMGAALGAVGFTLATAFDRKIRWAAVAVACVSLVVISRFAYTHHIVRLEARIQPTITALEAYRAENGAYPEVTRGEIGGGIELANCHRRQRAHYFRHAADARRFSITCVTFAFNKHTYDSNQGAWTDWD